MKITRMPKNGARDLGDLYGVEFAGNPMVVECKSPGKNTSWSVSGWWKETLKEAENHCTEYGFLAVKRFQKGVSQAICVVDGGMWGKILGDTLYSPTEVPSVGFSAWGELIDKHTVVATNRRGAEGNWYIMSLETMAGIIFTHRSQQEVNITPKNIENLMHQGSVRVCDSDGLPILLSLHSNDNNQ